MNKQGPGKIDYTDFSANFVRGKCQHLCPYCYMKPLWNRFPAMAETKIKIPKLLPKKSAVIFIGSSTDMWGKWVKSDWIKQVLDFITGYPQHTYLFLTKNPGRYHSFKFADNIWIGTTCDGLTPTKNNLKRLASHPHKNKWVSFEPLKEDLKTYDYLSEISWAVVGADSSKNAERPKTEWGDRLIQFLRIGLNIPVWVKDNWPELPDFKERPF